MPTTSSAVNTSPTTPRFASSSGIPARGFSKTDRARRRVDHARSYGFAQRAADNFHGFVDAHGPERDLGQTPWVRRVQHTYSENSARILAGTRDLLAGTITSRQAALARVQRVRARIDVLESTVIVLQKQANGLAADPPTARNGERHLDVQAALIRQDRHLQARRAGLDDQIADVQSQITALQTEEAEATEAAAQHEATVIEEFEMAVTIVVRMRDYYMRRLATYTRRLARREKLNGIYEVTLPGWTEQSCPWLPRPAG